MYFSKKKTQNDMWSWKNPTTKKFIVEPSFPKLDNNKWKMHTGARAREQKYISIYISLCMKTFLKTGVCIYIYIYIYIYIILEARFLKRLITWSWLFTLLHILVMCLSKLSNESILIPNKSILSRLSIIIPSITKVKSKFVNRFKTHWSGFVNIPSFLNQSTATHNSLFNRWYNLEQKIKNINNFFKL